MTKKDASEIPLAEPPPGFGPVGEAQGSAGRSLEDTTPGQQRGVQLAGGVPPSRRKPHDREAGPSEKQVYVPPVTLPPNKEPQALDSQKILVAPSVMVSSDERSRPTMRRIPVVMPLGSSPEPSAAGAQGAAGSSSRAQGVRTARYDVPVALPPPPDDMTPSARGMPARTHKMPAANAADAAAARPAGAPFTKKSPWARDGAAQVDKASLPSAQLLSTAAPLAAAAPAPVVAGPQDPRSAPRPLLGRALLVAGLVGVATVGVWYLIRWPTPQGSQPPIEVTAKGAPGPAAPPPAAAPAETVPPVQTAAPAEIAPPPVTAPPPLALTAPPPLNTPPVYLPPPVEGYPTVAPTRKPPRPSSPSATTPTAKPTAAPPPLPTTTAPPRPF